MYFRNASLPLPKHPSNSSSICTNTNVAFSTFLNARQATGFSLGKPFALREFVFVAPSYSAKICFFSVSNKPTTFAKLSQIAPSSSLAETGSTKQSSKAAIQKTLALTTTLPLFALARHYYRLWALHREGYPPTALGGVVGSGYRTRRRVWCCNDVARRLMTAIKARSSARVTVFCIFSGVRCVLRLDRKRVGRGKR